MQGINNHSTPEAKIALFRSLFRGRQDVYPRRFENRKTGASGYAPACANEWIRGICEKPRVKCAECQNRRFLPVTDDVVRQHLCGFDDFGKPFTLGLYPLLMDDTCLLLAIDLDGEGWQKDAAALTHTCKDLALPSALERSRSGKGGHLWFFFDSAVSARDARNLGSFLLTHTMEKRPEIGFGSYDRFFPNQDSMPRGGFGNLIALPLQKQPREHGNSLFLDSEFAPYADQWEFLASLPKLPAGRVKEISAEAERTGKVTGVRLPAFDDDGEAPWALPPSRKSKALPINEAVPEKVEIVLADQLYFEKENLPAALRNRLCRLAAFQNPEFYKAQAMRMPTFGKPRIIHCAEESSRHLAVPRGCLGEAVSLLKELKVKPELRDERFVGTELAAKFLGELRAEQELAAQAMLAHDTGVLAATTAFGKTVLASWLIAKRGVNTLILVHRQQLLQQWVERLSTFLDVEKSSIGQLGAGRKKLSGRLDVALIQSLVRKGTVHDCIANYGHLVIDECHHLPATSFELVARRAKSKYVTGLSASVTRKDGHHPIIFMQCGPVRYRVGAREQAAKRPFSHTVFVRPTNFGMARDPFGMRWQSEATTPRSESPQTPNPRQEFTRIYEALATSPARNEQICADVVAAVRAGRFPLVLTERTEHLALLAAKLQPHISHVITMQGGMGKKAAKAALAALADTTNGEGTVLLATGKYIGEGFDEPRLDTLFLTLPISWRGTIAQYVGRLHRLQDSKKEVQVYDYADLNVPMLARMFDRRCEGYEAIGYTIMLPGSAVPGWPSEVPLPIDPEWKRDYAASIRRLVRDGVDVPLANLFVYAAMKPLAQAEGVARARSASEAFLYRRLETLPRTSGKFRLNSELPIQFDAQGKMEVDFLCAEARLVIELDGSQHLADADAYRRDRRKDAVLQQHGFFVLRFLCEDLSKRLDEVLDGILRALEHQTHAVSALSVASIAPERNLIRS